MVVRLVECKTAASRSRLPGLDWAINPYRGCGHACAYCYAQDVTRFELGRKWGEVIEVKMNIVRVLKNELEKRVAGVYGVGTVTDPYQPLEKKHELTRGCLSVLRKAGAKASILTKSDLVLRDIDIIKQWSDVEVGMSLASLDNDLARLLEPGAPPPDARLGALKRLSEEGVRTYLMAAPIIRGITDSEENLRSLVRRARSAGVEMMIWDKLNPKPIASSRLGRILGGRGLSSPLVHMQDDVSRIRSILESECSSLGVKISDAF